MTATRRAPIRRARRHRVRHARARAPGAGCSSRSRASTTPFTGRQPPKGSHFVEPQLVCEVEFSEWTHAGTLRQPSYKGLRDDKRAEDVVRERVERFPRATRPLAQSPADAPAVGRPSSGRSGLDVQALLAGGRKVRDGVEVEVDGRTLKLTNADKVLYPATGFTKADLVAYYAGVGPALLPHLHDRPLTLKRYPERGRRASTSTRSARPRTGPTGFRPCRSRANAARRRSPTRSARTCRRWSGWRTSPTSSCTRRCRWPPTSDARRWWPSTSTPARRRGSSSAVRWRSSCASCSSQLGLEACAKTSGSKGLQVYVPLNRPDVSYEQTKPFAHAVAGLLEERHPQLVVSSMAKSKRRGQGADRLEPERRAQDDRERLLAAGDRAAERLDAGRLGGGRRVPPSGASRRCSASAPKMC